METEQDKNPRGTSNCYPDGNWWQRILPESQSEVAKS